VRTRTIRTPESPISGNPISLVVVIIFSLTRSRANLRDFPCHRAQQQRIWSHRAPDLAVCPRRQAKTTEVTAKMVERGREKGKKLAIREQPRWPWDLTRGAETTVCAMWWQTNLVGVCFLDRGGRWRRRWQDRLLVVDEESVEAATGGSRCHRPDKNFDGQGHNLSDFVAEHDRKERREAPNPSLDRRALGGVAIQLLVVAQAGEEGQQVEVRYHDEGDGASVAVGAINRHAGVEGEEEEAKHREPREVGHRCRRR